MPTTALLLRYARDAAPPDAPGPADSDLLAQYASARDEAAFAELVRRNGPLVHRACWHVLGEAGADDAFQATFLLLARSARRLTGAGSLAGWLHAAAVRIARNVRRGEDRRRRREAANPGPAAAPDDLTWREVREVLDAEIAALPERDRLPLVLCYLQELSYEEAARRAGCTVGALRGRLERGKECLRLRLARHGLPLAAPVLLVGAPQAVSAAQIAAAVAVVRAGAAVPPAVAHLLPPPGRSLAALLLAPAVAVAVAIGAVMALAVPADHPPKAAPPVAVAPVASRPPANRLGDPLPGGVVTSTDNDWTYPVAYKGKPAAGAKVGLSTVIYPTSGEPKAADPVFATTDGKGEVRFPRPPQPGALARLLARNRDGRGGYGTLSGETRYPPTLDLYDNTELAGRVTDAAGKPIPGLKLTPAALGSERSPGHADRLAVAAETPAWFWEAFPTRLAADGSFTAPGVPAGHSIAVQFEAPGFGSGRFWVSPNKLASVVLQKAGGISLRFVAPAGAKAGDVRVCASRTTGSEFIEATANATAKAGGAVTLPDLPPGEYRLSFPYSGPSPLFPQSVGPTTVKPGETVELTVPLEPAVRVTARLVDSKIGTGVPKAKLSAGISRPGGDYVAVTDVEADADGKVELLVPAGMVSVSPRTADGYAVVRFSTNSFNQYSTEPVPLTPGKAHDFGRFSLVKTVEVAGVVVDEAGGPVAGARVFTGYNPTSAYSGKGTLTAADGTFVIKGINPEGGVFGITARKGGMIAAAPVGVDPAKPEGEARIVISEKFAARVRIRAVDRAGKPLAAVPVELTHSVSFLHRGAGPLGFGTGGKVGHTAADGRFESDVLQPGDRYSVSLSALGYRSEGTPDSTPKPGETHDYGDMVLIRADLAVTGMVADPAGKPIAGAAVFGNADGPRPAAATTDPAGRFTLAGLYEGPAFVAVRADGFRLAIVRAETGGPAVAVTLRRVSAPPDPPPVVSDQHQAATAKLTRHLLDVMWANRIAAGDDGKFAIQSMAKFDLGTARKWRDEEKARAGGVDLTAEIEAAVRDKVLLKTAREDSAEAVALLKPVGGVEGFRAVCAAASRLLPEHPEKALPLAEEAVARARGLEQAERTWALAQAGELVYRAGRKDAGRKVIEEAAKLTGPLGFDDLDGYRRGMVACRIALYDPAACRAMIDPMKQASDFNRWLAQACPRVAETDLPLVRKWLAEFRPDNSFSRHVARQWVAYRIVGTDPDGAVAIAEGIEEPTIRATTLAGVALRLKDKVRAAKLIDAAMERILADPRGYYNGGAGGTAGLVLYRAKQLGHPDLAGLRDMVLAARTAPRSGEFSGGNPASVLEALTLALTDPETARLLLTRAVTRADLLDSGNLRNREPLTALALADPVALIPVVDELITRAVKMKKGYGYTGLETLAAVLADPDRVAENARRSGRLLGDFDEE